MRDNEGCMDRKSRPERCEALHVLRWMSGLKEKEAAERSGIDPNTLSDYERGKKTPSLERLRRFAASLGQPDALVDRTLAMVREIRAALAPPGHAADPLAAARPAIDRWAAAGGAAAEDYLRKTLERLATRALAEEERCRAREAWDVLGPYPPQRRRELLAAIPEAKTWALVERTCDASVAAAADDAAQAVELADLAVWIAAGAPGGEAARGYAWAFLGNAWRVQGELKRAEMAFRRSHELWREEAAGALDRSRVLDLEASLRRCQRRLPEALALLDRALGAATSMESRGRILIKRAKTLEETGDYPAAVAALRQAEPLLGDQRNGRVWLTLRFNLAENLLHLGQHEEAEAMVEEVRRLTLRLRKALDETRLHWLEGRIAAGHGRMDEAIAILMKVRGEFASRLMAFDGALASLELAELFAAQGQPDAVKSLARQMAWVFQGQGVHSEARKAIALFRRAAEQEAVTAELARRLVEYLHLARHDPQLRFEAA